MRPKTMTPTPPPRRPSMFGTPSKCRVLRLLDVLNELQEKKDLAERLGREMLADENATGNPTDSLSEHEKRVFVLLQSSREQTAFMFCRELSRQQPEEDQKPGTFRLSKDQFLKRLGGSTESKGAHWDANWILKRLDSFGVLRVVQPGNGPSKGVKARATLYQWLIS